ncbi:MAG: type II secretion system protein [bacterium]
MKTKGLTRSISDNENGFTLLEILVAMAIVGILAAAYITVFRPLFGQSKVTAAVGSIDNLKTNAITYANQNSGSFSSISIANMVTAGLLGDNWNNVCPPASGEIAHCNPWNGAYEINAVNSDVFNVELINIPEANAYAISSQMWNSTDNNSTDTGGASGTEFMPTSGSPIYFVNGDATKSTTLGNLLVYFSY